MTMQGEGLQQYYLQHIHELQLLVHQKNHNLNCLEAQCNELNSRESVDQMLAQMNLAKEFGADLVKVRLDS
uniref:Uncharacterized protein MANES_14G128200 n=1 Tax=Rhizophora mucronata TaxID=61149 RepID=A0A2P2MV51_RHIMU